MQIQAAQQQRDHLLISVRLQLQVGVSQEVRVVTHSRSQILIHRVTQALQAVHAPAWPNRNKRVRIQGPVGYA